MSGLQGTVQGAPRGLIKNGDVRVRACRYGMMLYSIKDIYIGRSLETYGEYCEASVDLYRKLLEPGQVVIDAGANIGCHTVPFAKAVGEQGQVHGFEPQRRIFQMLLANVAMNDVGNVHGHQIALGDRAGEAFVPELDYRVPGDFGGVALSEQGTGEPVALATIDGLGLGRCNFIKIDVSGMEQSVLLGASETIGEQRPMLYVEVGSRDQAPDLVRLLMDWNYRLFWHLPRFFNPKNFYGVEGNLYGDMMKVRLLGLPAEAQHIMRGLTPIQSPNDWWNAD